MGDPGPTMALTGNGERLHLQHGPIDLLIEADGPAAARSTTFAAAAARFESLLDELVAELDTLRSALTPASMPVPRGRVAMRMVEAVFPHCHEETITPMAAVAGAVADEIGEAMAGAASLRRWMVNNGGDISIGLTPGQRYTVGLVVDPRRGTVDGTIVVKGGTDVGGIATSGRHGRSFSLGIADAVTVTSHNAAAADAAATIIANKVDIGPHSAVTRVPAYEVDPDTDLGDRLVTVDVGLLTTVEVRQALDSGLARAETLVAGGSIVAAVLHLDGSRATTASTMPMRCCAGDRTAAYTALEKIGR